MDAHAVVYVLEGEVEVQVRGGTLQRLSPGQIFYESPEDVHTVSRNASKTKPVSATELCTKTLILVSLERSVQYRERSAAVAHSTNQTSEFRRNVECASAALRSRYCTDRSPLTKIRIFRQHVTGVRFA